MKQYFRYCFLVEHDTPRDVLFADACICRTTIYMFPPGLGCSFIDVWFCSESKYMMKVDDESLKTMM